MNLLKEITLTIFGLIVIVFTVVYSVILLGWIEIEFLTDLHQTILETENVKNFVLVLNAVLILMAFISIFGSGNKKDKRKAGILLENEKGKLLISKETLENIVNNVIKGFEEVYVNSVKTELNEDSKLNVIVGISVGAHVVIKDLSNNIQNKIKEAIKKSSDLEVGSVDINIRGIIEKKVETTGQ